VIDISPHPDFHYFEDLISPEECKVFYYRLLAESVNNIDNPRPNYKFLDADWGWDPDLNSKFDPTSKIKNSVIFPAQDFFVNNYKMEYKFEIKRVVGNVMKPGSICEAHNDDGDVYLNKPKIEKHYSGLFFFNDDYEGGELYFSNLGMKIKPKVGSLVLFRGDEHRLHGVNEVKSGYRGNLLMFWRDALM